MRTVGGQGNPCTPQLAHNLPIPMWAASHLLLVCSVVVVVALSLGSAAVVATAVRCKLKCCCVRWFAVQVKCGRVECMLTEPARVVVVIMVVLLLVAVCP